MQFVLGSLGSSPSSSSDGSVRVLNQAQSAPPEKRDPRSIKRVVRALEHTQSGPSRFGAVAAIALPELARRDAFVSALNLAASAVSQFVPASEAASQFVPVSESAAEGAPAMPILEGREIPLRVGQQEALRRHLPRFIEMLKRIQSSLPEKMIGCLEDVIRDIPCKNRAETAVKRNLIQLSKIDWKLFSSEDEESPSELLAAMKENLGMVIQGLDDLSKLEEPIKPADIAWIWIAAKISVDLSPKFWESASINTILVEPQAIPQAIKRLGMPLESLDQSGLLYKGVDWSQDFCNQIGGFYDFSTKLYNGMYDILEFLQDKGMGQEDVIVNEVISESPPSIEKMKSLIGQFPVFATQLENFQFQNYLCEGFGALEDLIGNIPDSQIKQEFIARLEKFWKDFSTPVFAGNAETCPLGVVQELRNEYQCLIQGFNDLSENQVIGSKDIKWIWEYIERVAFLCEKTYHNPTIRNGKEDLTTLLQALENEIVIDLTAEEQERIKLCTRLFLSQLNWVSFTREIHSKLVNIAGKIEDVGFPFVISRADQRNGMKAKHCSLRKGVLSPRPPSVEVSSANRSESATPTPVWVAPPLPISIKNRLVSRRPSSVELPFTSRSESATPALPTGTLAPARAPSAPPTIDGPKLARRSRSAASSRVLSGARSAGLTADSPLEYRITGGRVRTLATHNLATSDDDEGRSEDEGDVDFCGLPFSWGKV